MTYEAIPANISNDPDLMRQFVLGQLPPTGSFPGRIVKNAATNIADLVGWVEGGYLTIETINRVLSDSPQIRSGGPTPLDADGWGTHQAHDIGAAVSAAIQQRHQALTIAAGAARMEAEDVGIAMALPGIDDVPAAIASLPRVSVVVQEAQPAHELEDGTKIKAVKEEREDREPEWHLAGDELYVRGVPSEQVAEALRLTRPAPA